MKAARRSARLLLLLSALLAVFGVLTVLMTLVFRNGREYQRLITAGDAALSSGQSFAALEAYSGAVALRPDAMLPHLKRGGVYYTRGDYQSAVRDLRRAVDRDPSAPRALELLGDASAAYGRHASAVASYQRYLQVDDRSASVLYKLGLALYQDGQAAAAVTQVTNALRINGDVAEAHHLLGLCFQALVRTQEARGAFERAIRLTPAFIAPREALGKLYLDEGHQQLAIEQLEALATLEPLRPDRVAAVSLAHSHAGRVQAALTRLEAGLERFPNDALLHALHGRTWLQLAGETRDPGASARATRALQRAASSPSASSQALSIAAEGLMLAGDRETARKAIEEALLRQPVDPSAYRHAAESADAAGDWQRARDDYVRYATLVTDALPRGAVALRIADLSSALGERHIAVRWFERALADAEPSAEVLARFAAVVLDTGDTERARMLILDGLAIDGAHAVLKALHRRLEPAP